MPVSLKRCEVRFRQLRTCRRIGSGQECAKTDHEQMQQLRLRKAVLFDHLVREGEQRRGHIEAERLGGLEIDD